MSFITGIAQIMDWMIYQGIGVPSNPVFHKIPSVSDCQKIMDDLNVPLLRWIEDWDCQFIYPYYDVILDHHLELPELKRQVRYEVNRALRNYYFIELSFSEIINEGFLLFKKSFDTYDTYLKPASKDEFINNYSKYLDNGKKDFAKFFGIRESSSNLLVCYAYGVWYLNGNYYDLKVVKLDPEHQKNNISELLFFELARQLLSLNKVSFIFDGFVSIAHKSGIQEYLIRKFNYRRAYCRLCIYYQFHIKLFVFFLFHLDE